MAESEEDDCGQGAAPPASLTPLPLLTPFSATPLLHLVDSYSPYHIFYLPETYFQTAPASSSHFAKLLVLEENACFSSSGLGCQPPGQQASDQVAAKLTGTHLSWNYPSYTLSRCPSTTFLFFEQLILQSDKSQTE